MQFHVACRQLLKQLLIDNELTRRRVGADIYLLGQLNIGSREALWINPLERPSGSLPAGFTALDPGEPRRLSFLLRFGCKSTPPSGFVQSLLL
jgi:hypothetical protein